MSSAMECPRCKEIALALVDEEIVGTAYERCVRQYECSECGHIETHVGGLPSWYTQGGTP